MYEPIVLSKAEETTKLPPLVVLLRAGAVLKPIVRWPLNICCCKSRLRGAAWLRGAGHGKVLTGAVRRRCCRMVECGAAAHGGHVVVVAVVRGDHGARVVGRVLHMLADRAPCRRTLVVAPVVIRQQPR